MRLKKIRPFIFAAAMAGIVTIGGIAAYFTDTDAVTNTFTVGKISLDLQEPDWDPEEGKDITPGKTIKKDPQILNDGTNPAFIFAEVVIPYRNLVTANADGTKNAAADTILFDYTVNSGWTELGTVKKDTDKKTVTHLYVYGTSDTCTELAVGDTTPAIFDNVTFANIVEEKELENSKQEILINAYGIQTTDINGGKTAPADVWQVLSAQSPTLEAEQTEDAKTDVKQ